MSGIALGIAAVLVAVLSVYLLACVAAALPFARVLPLRSLLILPGIIAVYHVAYGLGFLSGILKFALRRSASPAPSTFFHRFNPMNLTMPASPSNC